MMSLTFGLFTQVSGSGPLGPLVIVASLINRGHLIKERIHSFKSRQHFGNTSFFR